MRIRTVDSLGSLLRKGCANAAFGTNATLPAEKEAEGEGEKEAVAEGQTVFSWGCDRGALPSRYDSKITKLNRYLGAPNVEVAGQPVEGRSGGGLFDESGELIGVCYAADPELQEGLYNGAEVVYYQLAKLGLHRLFNERTGELPNTNNQAREFPPDRTTSITSELTVLLKGSDGKQEQLHITQPNPQLLQALRDSSRRQ